ncbi:phospholipase A2 inhibitor 25 kDa subunit-like isoform X3 [Lissotriton helveticus]
MRTSLVITCILSALLAQDSSTGSANPSVTHDSSTRSTHSSVTSGKARSCLQCIDFNVSSCKGSKVACPSGADHCMSTLTKTTITGVSHTTVFARTCGTSKDCNKMASLTNPKITIKLSSTCCTTDDCTPPEPKLPTPKTTKTNVTCHSCLDLSSTSCYSKDTITCSGDETKCIRYALKSTIGSTTTKVATRGCATPSFCAFQSTSESAGDTTVVTDLACTDGGICLHKSVFLLALSGLLALRLPF